jgi:hypothetical protein
MRCLALLLLLTVTFTGVAKADEMPSITGHVIPDGVRPANKGMNWRGEEVVEFAKDTIWLSPDDHSTEDSSNKTALLKPDSQGIYRLNPELKGNGFAIQYTNIPATRELTPSFCDNLWGKNVSDSPNYRTYRLLEVVPKKDIVDGVPREYFIDAIFENGKLCKYRLRGPKLQKQSWQSS